MVRIWILLLLFVLPLCAKIDTLESLIASALRHNNDLLIKRAKMRQLEAKRRENSLSRLGSFDLIGSYTHYNLPRTLTPITPDTLRTGASDIVTTDTTLSVGIAYRATLYQGGAQAKQSHIDALNLTMAKGDIALTETELVYHITDSYISILSLQAHSKAQHHRISALRRLVRTVEAEVKYGKKAAIDLLKAQSALEEARAQKAQIDNNIKQLKASLALLSGKKRIRRLAPVNAWTKRSRPTLNKALAKVDKLLKVASAQKKVALTQKKLDKKERLLKGVRISFDAVYSYNMDAKGLPSPSEAEAIAQAQLRLHKRLYDFGKSDAQLQQIKIEKMKATIEKEKIVEEIKASLKKAYARLESAYAQYKASKKQLALSDKSVTIELQRYKHGLSTINDLLTAKASRHLALAQKIRSQYEILKAEATIDYLLERRIDEN